MPDDEFLDPSAFIARAREEALDRVLAGMAIVGAVGAPLSVMRSSVTGWMPVYGFHLLVGLTAVGLWLFRKQLPVKVRCGALIAMMWSVGLLGVFTLGMLGAGTWWLAASALIAGMAISLRLGTILGACALVLLVLVAGGFTSGLLTLGINLDAFMSTYSTWATYILVAAWLPMVIFSAFLKHSELIALLAEDTAKAQQKLREFANVDTLTGAVRPHVLEEKLQGAIEQSERESSCVGVVFIDLDRFKPINDTYGHAAGDLILKTVVERAGKLLRSGDTISRIGGDEFVVALPGIQSEAEAEQVAEKLHKALVQPVEFEGQSIDVGLSMGVAVATHGCASGPQLVKAADELMYEAKRSGRNCFFSRKLSADVCAA